MMSSRLRYLLAILPALAIALASIWVLEVMRRSTQEDLPAAVDKSVPDYFVDQFKLVAMSPTGQPRYILTGEKMKHFPSENAATITNPVVISLDMGVPPTTLSAERAKVEDGTRRVHMIDNVNADRPASDQDARTQSGHLHFSSEYLLVLPDDDLLKTDQPVEITSDDSVLRGTGMIFNNKTREITLLNKVSGVYQTPTKTTFGTGQLRK